MRQTRRRAVWAGLAGVVALAVLCLTAALAVRHRNSSSSAKPDGSPACAASDQDGGAPAATPECGVDFAILNPVASALTRTLVATSCNWTLHTEASPARILSVAPKTSPPARS